MSKTIGSPKFDKRSDCQVIFVPTNKGGVKITVKSKVAALYGKETEQLVKEMCSAFKIKNAVITIEDNGALPYVIAARFEAAYKQSFPESSAEYLLPFNKKNNNLSAKDHLRRSRLYIPGNEPKYFINAGLYKSDAIIYDLEDSVAPSEKISARLLVRNALRVVDLYGAERMVRINQLPAGLEDIKVIAPHNVHVILIPKCESDKDVLKVDDEISKMKMSGDIKNDILLIPIIESAAGVINAYRIASASKNVCALSIGLEDYTADIGVERTTEGKESLFARCSVINAAKAAGVQALDSVFSDVEDIESLKQSVLEAKSLGFEGKGCIHPRQVEVINESFVPSVKEIEYATKVIAAYDEARRNKLGVVAIGNKMIDAPVVKRAYKIIELAKVSGRI